jgi:Big-like domain-containing protein
MLTSNIKWARTGTLLAFVACADPVRDPLQPNAVASVSVSPTERELVVGEAGRLSAIAQAANGTALPGRVIQWWSDRPNIASVDANGLVIAIAEGTALVHASSEGKSGVATIRVMRQTAVPALAIMNLTPVSAIAGGTDFALVVHGTGFGPTATVYWDGLRRLTSRVSDAELHALITRTDITFPAAVPITVVNEGSKRSVSNALSFRVVVFRNRR